MEKGKVVKTPELRSCGFFMDPPHWVLIAVKGSRQERGGGGGRRGTGWLQPVEEEEESDGAAVIYEVTQDSGQKKKEVGGVRRGLGRRRRRRRRAHGEPVMGKLLLVACTQTLVLANIPTQLQPNERSSKRTLGVGG